MRACSVFLLLGIFLANSVASEDWPRFRGPNGSGVSGALGLTDDLAPRSAAWWREVLFGRSSPIVVGGLVVLTGLEGEELVTAAYDAGSGDERWRASVTRVRVDKTAPETGPSVATPVSDGRSIFSFFPEYGLVAYDLAGAERWRLSLPPFSSYYGLASSPVIDGDVLVLVCDQTREPYVIGVDTASGRQLWKKRRDVRGESWTTPVIYRAGTDEALALVFGSYNIDAYGVGDGELRWRLPGLGFTPVASPVLHDDLLVAVAPNQSEGLSLEGVTEGFQNDKNGDGYLSEEEMAGLLLSSAFTWLDMNGDGLVDRREYGSQVAGLQSPDFGLVAIDLAADGGPEIRWRQRKTLPYIATPILYRGVLFLVKDGGILTSYDPSTGEVLKRARLEGAVEPFFPSPGAADGKLYLPASGGSFAVVSAEAKWRLLSLVDFDEEVFASPAVAGGRLFVRTKSKLYAFGGKS
jgi:outer membrane protein assembly factor BamB